MVATNDFYENTATLVNGETAQATTVEADFDGVQAGFDLVNVETDRAIKMTNADFAGGELSENAVNRAGLNIGFDETGAITLRAPGLAWKGDHVTTTLYKVNDIVRDAAGDISVNSLYICITQHVSTTDMTDNSASWDLFINVAALESAQTAAEAAQAAAELAETNAETAETGAQAAQALAEAAQAAAELAETGAEAAQAAAESVLASATGYQRKTAAYTMVAGDRVIADISGGAFDLTLPASPSEGDAVWVVGDGGSNYTTNATVLRNGQTMDGTTENFDIVCDNLEHKFTFLNSSWRIFV